MNSESSFMSRKAVLLTTAHSPFDERIFYHQGISMQRFGFDCTVVSSYYKEELDSIQDGIRVIAFDGNTLSRKEKLQRLHSILSQLEPDLVLCSEPMALKAMRLFKNKNKTHVLYDVTEWFPSYKHLRKYSFLKKLLVAPALFFFNLWEAAHAKAFIFGEKYKQYPYILLFPGKKSIILPYYPKLEYINYKEKEPPATEVSLGFSGNISEGKGALTFIKVLQELALLRPELKLTGLVTGFFPGEEDRQRFEDKMGVLPANVHINIQPWLPFKDFASKLDEAHIYCDLRDRNMENNHALPIKVFYYAAAGRPVIYSDLKAVRKQTAITEFGFLVDPADTVEIARLVQGYIDDKELYNKHCKRARELAETRYNWNLLADNFINFINSFH